MKKIGAVLATLLVPAFLMTGVVWNGAMAQDKMEKAAASKGKSDTDAVKAALGEFNAALSALDMNKMQATWAHMPYAVLINPRDKTGAVGWDEITKRWEGVFDFWSELKVSTQGTPQVHVKGNTAWTHSMGLAEGRTKNGEALKFVAIVTDVFEKQGGRWLVVSHHASRMPE